jgi:nucleoside-diphosphate-sugar epimerase
MKLLLTGISSFTGSWFADALASAGHEVVAPLRGTLAGYDTARRQRLERLGNRVRVVESAPFGSDAFLRLLAEPGPFDGLCHHGAEVANYRSPDFDVAAALQNNTAGLRGVLTTLRATNSRAFVVLTGSVFENDEGRGEEPLRAFSPYGLSKGLTWQAFRYYCGVVGVPLGKFVIPNPFGPWEEPRFTAYLVRNWKEGKTPSIQTPDYVRDNIHVDLLALAYAAFVVRRADGSEAVLRANPSGYVESQGAFARRFAAEMARRTGRACPVEALVQKDFVEPMERVNLEPAAPRHPEWSEARAWDAVAAYSFP